ncbi:MAG: 50S ribosomal protein L10 [Armatimonadetes bacterium]|jgi:large subunit ribosomal protein L10|nr:50S ribosomal protein L10 [Armatimonadota bacterium]MDI9603680.1 50S ribosomal protein L10 [Acidobacteriota bacterium]
MPTAAKEKAVEELNALLSERNTVLLVGYRGLKVTDLQTLRAQLKAPGASMRIIKNTLFRLAAKGTPAEPVSEILDGPCAIVFDGEPSAAAKALTEFAKKKPALLLHGGVLDGAPLDSAGVEALSKAPTREELLSGLVAGLQGPISGLVYALHGVVSQLVYALDEIKTQKEEAA